MRVHNMRRMSIFILGIVILLRRDANKTKASGELSRFPERRYINKKLVVESLLRVLIAERAGVRGGDIIVYVAGKKYEKKESSTLIENKQRGDHVLSVINRNGQLISMLSQ